MCYGELISASMVRARKEHRCDYCGKRVAPGDRYIREASKFDGRLVDAKMHRRCVEIQEALWHEYGESMCWVEPRDAARAEAEELEGGWRNLRGLVRRYREWKQRTGALAPWERAGKSAALAGGAREGEEGGDA